MKIQFNRFIGNKKVKEQLAALMQAGRFPHAVIFEGEEGLGKRTIAQEVADALLCRGENKPCHQCSQCKKADAKIHPDLFLHSAAGGARSFHIDTVRSVIEDVCIQPNEAEYKVYILGNVHLMSTSAQNAILKVLEEPPSYVRFILTTENKSALLPTVLSRSVVFTLEGVFAQDGAKYISSNFDDISFEEAADAVNSSGGNIGKALSGLKEGKLKKSNELCTLICAAVCADNEYELIKLMGAFNKDREKIATVCELIKSVCRDALVYDSGVKALSDTQTSVELFASRLTKQQIFALMHTVQEIKKEANMNANNSLLITKFCYALRRAVCR